MKTSGAYTIEVALRDQRYRTAGTKDIAIITPPRRRINDASRANSLRKSVQTSTSHFGSTSGGKNESTDKVALDQFLGIALRARPGFRKAAHAVAPIRMLRVLTKIYK